MLVRNSGTPLMVGVSGADQRAREAYVAALASALTASALNAMLIRGPGADVHFLLGIDAPGKTAAQDIAMYAADTALRQQLDDAGVTYAVLHGNPASQVKGAIAAIERRLRVDLSEGHTVRPPASPPWVWPCDKCGDAGCEFKLLTNLLSERRATP